MLFFSLENKRKFSSAEVNFFALASEMRKTRAQQERRMSELAILPLLSLSLNAWPMKRNKET